MPVLWKIRCYRSTRGVDEVRKWYDGIPTRAQVKFRGRVSFLAQTPRSGWKREPFDLLTGYDLGEIRFNVGGVEYRPLGFFSPGMTFTIAVGATERDGKFDPKRAPETAMQRKEEIESDASRTCPWPFPLEFQHHP